MDVLFSLLYAHPLIPYALGLIGLLVLYRKFAYRLTSRGPRATVSMPGSDVLGKLLGPGYARAKVRKQVEQYKKQGHFLAAGKLLEDSGKLAEAAEAYALGNENWAAAASLEKLGRVDKAAELYLQAGDHKKAAQILADAGKPGRAAALFLEKGNTLDAARLFGLAGDWGRTAELYARGGYPLRAAEAYEKAGDPMRAAECYERHFMENVSYATTYSSTASSADHKSAAHAGRLYEQAGNLDRALQAYMKGGFHREAADVCMKSGQYAKGAELYLRAGDPAASAAAYERQGDPVQAALLRGEAALKDENVAEAAAQFQQGQDYLRAAELFESVGMLAEAAAAYEAGDSHAAAGSVYVRAGLTARGAAAYQRAGDHETAARLYEEAGDGRRAAELYEKAGYTFRSGQAAAAAGDRDRAIGLLQRVGPNDEDHAGASALLARLFIEGRRPDLALERLRRILAGQPVSAASLDLHYWHGMALEASGRNAEAIDVYRKVLAEDLQYADVEKRLAALAAGRPLPPPAAGSPPAAPPHAAAASPSATMAPAARAAPSVPSFSPEATLPPTSAGLVSPATPPTRPRFVLKEEVGRGPLGPVFRGEDRDGRSVAMRMLPRELVRQDGMLPALAADLKAAAQISHPNLVKVIGFTEVDGQRCVVTEFVPGRTLTHALRTHQKMSMPQVHGLGRVLAQALSAVHGRGLVHGSVQPSNVMVANGVLKLADLGLLRLANELPHVREYRPPDGGLDAGADLYALAALLYRLLTGVHPKSQPQGVALPLPSKLTPGVPEAMDKLLVRCLHPRRELRLASAEEMLGELKGMVRIV